MNTFVYGAIIGFAGAYLLHSSGIVHHAAPAVKPVPVNIPLTPDTACGDLAPGKPALTVSVNNIPFVVELDSGAAFALMTPTTAARINLTSFPKADVKQISFTGQATNNFQGYRVPLVIPGLPVIPMNFYTGPPIGCNLLPTVNLNQIYNIDLTAKSVTFTHV